MSTGLPTQLHDRPARLFPLVLHAMDIDKFPLCTSVAVQKEWNGDLPESYHFHILLSQYLSGRCRLPVLHAVLKYLLLELF